MIIRRKKVVSIEFSEANINFLLLSWLSDNMSTPFNPDCVELIILECFKCAVGLQPQLFAEPSFLFTKFFSLSVCVETWSKQSCQTSNTNWFCCIHTSVLSNIIRYRGTTFLFLSYFFFFFLSATLIQFINLLFTSTPGDYIVLVGESGGYFCVPYCMYHFDGTLLSPLFLDFIYVLELE